MWGSKPQCTELGGHKYPDPTLTDELNPGQSFQKLCPEVSPATAFWCLSTAQTFYLSTASLINHKLRSSPVTAALAYTLLLFMLCSQMNVDFITSEETTSGGSVTARIIYITLMYLLFHLFIFYPLCVLFTWILMLS